MALVSVIIPTHNRANLVGRAIESVLRQTYGKIEIIVVDDASTDATEAAVGRIADSRVSYHKLSRNVGGSASRNYGLEMAQGEVVAFLDDDDYWDDRKLEKQISLLEVYDAVASGVEFFGGSRLSGQRYVYPYQFVRIEDLKKSNAIGSTSVFIAHKKCFGRIRFDETLRQSQDWDLYLSFVEHGYKIGFCQESLAHISDEPRRARITTSLQDVPLQRLKEFALLFEKRRNFFGDWWYRHHKAVCYLSYFMCRKDKLKLLAFAIREAGVIAVVAVLFKKCFKVL